MTMNAVHYSSASAEWLTPAHVLDRVQRCLGSIDLDPCSNAGPIPNVPATTHYSAADDGLSRPWHGRVYLNPPYGRTIGQWVAKLCAEYTAGRLTAAIGLLPARPDTVWWQQLRPFPVCFVRGRLRFSGHANSAPFPSALVFLGDDLAAFSAAFGDLGDIRMPADGAP